jgi:hypothetical protein
VVGTKMLLLAVAMLLAAALFRLACGQIKGPGGAELVV